MEKSSFKSALLDGFRNWRRGEFNAVQELRNQLVVLGYWTTNPVERKHVSQLNLFISRIILSQACFVAFFVLPLNAYKYSDNNAIICLESLAFIFVSGMIGIQAASIILRGRLFDEVMTSLKEMEDLGDLHHEKPDSIFTDSKWMTYFIFYYYAFLFLVILPLAGVLIPIGSFIIREDIVRIWYPWDSTISPIFEITVLAWMWPITAGIHLMVIVNAFFMALMVEAIRHLRLVNHNLRHVEKTLIMAADSREMSSNESLDNEGTQTSRQQSAELSSTKVTNVENQNHKINDSELRHLNKKIAVYEIIESHVRASVRHQEAIARFVEKVSEAFDPILLHQLSCSVCPIVLGIIFINKGIEQPHRLVGFGCLIVGCLVDQMAFCWLGDKVAEESSLVRDAVFGCDWFDQSESFKRSMRIIMSRSNQPLVVMVAGFIPLTLETFYGVMKLTFSYYTSLKNVFAIRR